MDGVHGEIGEVRGHPAGVEREFRELYGKLRKKYGLEKHEYSSVYESRDDLIEIWGFERGKRKCICSIRRRDIKECYAIAILDLEFYEEKMRAAEAGSRA